MLFIMLAHLNLLIHADYSDDEKEDILKNPLVFPDNPDVLLAIDTIQRL